MKRQAAALLFMSVVLCAITGVASPHRVVQVSFAGGGAGDLAPLVEAELSAATFDVEHVSFPRRPDARDLARLTEQRETAIAAVVVAQDDRGLYARVWLTDRDTQEGTLHEVRADGSGDDGARLIALKVVELLHARALELSVERETTPAPSANDDKPSDELAGPPSGPAAADGTDGESGESSRAAPGGARPSAESTGAPTTNPRTVADDGASATRRRDPDATSWAAAAGASILGGPGSMPIGVAPAAVLSLEATPHFAAELFAVAPALGTVEDPAGSATVDQELIAARGRLSIGQRPLAPHVALGLGVYRIGASGDAAQRGYEGQTVEQFAMATLLGLGLRFHASENLRLLAETTASFVIPRPTVRFGGRAAAATGAPLIVGVAAMELAW